MRLGGGAFLRRGTGGLVVGLGELVGGRGLDTLSRLFLRGWRLHRDLLFVRGLGGLFVLTAACGWRGYDRVRIWIHLIGDLAILLLEGVARQLGI